MLRGLSIIAVLIALAGSAAVAADNEMPSAVADAASATSADSPLGSKVQQLAAVERAIAEAECGYAVDAAILEACDQLQAQAKMLAGEIDALKAGAANPAERTATRPQREKPYNFAARTNPDMSYRTVCVRECDGFYYPMSEASKPGSFLADEAKCRASCSSAARLYYSPAASDDASAMVALTGERYGELANAFRYRSEYVEACTCKPMPWTAEAKTAFDRRAVLATRTPNETIVAAGAGEVAKLLAGGEVKVAAHVRSPKRRYDRMVVERSEVRPFFFRPFRKAYAFNMQASAESLPQRRFFLFRGRY